MSFASEQQVESECYLVQFLGIYPRLGGEIMRTLAFLLVMGWFSNAAATTTVKSKTVDYAEGNDKFSGHFVVPTIAKGKLPGVLLIHNWMGISDETKKQAERMAKLGMAVFAVDVYGKGIRPKEAKEAMPLAAKYKGDRSLFRKRLLRGLAVLREQPGVDGNRMMVAGYCFGGTGALELARAGADVKAAVSFHGGLDSPVPGDGKNIKGRVVAFHGADDPYVKASDLAAFQEEMRTHQVDWQMTWFGGAVHSFTEEGAGNDVKTGAAYNQNADRRSFAALTELVRELFPAK
jgi:dienelactone hydrolase